MSRMIEMEIVQNVGGIKIAGERVDKGFLRYNANLKKYETILPDNEASPSSTNIVENGAVVRYANSNFGNHLGLSIDTDTYIMTISLINADNEVIDSKQVDLPLESMFMSARYENGIIYLTMESGDVLEINITDLVSGYVDTQTFENREAEVNISLEAKVDKTTKINNKALSSDITLTNQDVGAMSENQKVGYRLSVSGQNVSLKDQNGDTLNTIETQDTTYSNATSESAGLMSATDKGNLDSLVRNDNGYITKNVDDLTNYTDTTTLNNAMALKQDKTDNTLDTTSKTVVGAINEVNSMAKQSNKSLSYSDYLSFITIFNSLDKDTYNKGQSIYILTTEVPDLWIYNISDSSSTFTYQSDSQVVNLLIQNGYIQVGYYLIGMLETAKVDLTNYYTKNETYSKSEVDASLSEKANDNSVVHLANNETISGIKTFNANPYLANNVPLMSKSANGPSVVSLILINNNDIIELGSSNADIRVSALNSLSPITNNSKDLGSSLLKWKDLYLSGNLTDGTNSIAIGNIENSTNKVSEINAQNKTSTTQYTSIKAVADYVDSVVGDIETALTTLDSGTGV